MTTLFAKSAGGNWSAAATWSNTGSGGVDSSGPPSTVDNVVLESGSGQVTVDTAVSGRSLDCTSGTGSYTNTLTMAAGSTLTLGDATAGTGNVALKLSSGMTLTYAGGVSIRLFSTSATQQSIDFAGKSPSSLIIGTGVGGNYKLAAGQTITTSATFPGSISHNRGTFDFNDAIVSMVSYGTAWIDTAPVLTLGTSQLTFTSTGVAFQINDSGAATINQGTSSITLSGAAARFLCSSSYTFYDFAFTGEGKCTIEGGVSETFHNLTRTGPGVAIDKLQLGGNVTVSNNFTVTGGSKAYPVRVVSDTASQRTITCNGTVSVQDAQFQSIVGAGSGSWNLASNRVFDAGGNSGITFQSYAIAETRFNNCQYIDVGNGMGATEKSGWR